MRLGLLALALVMSARVSHAAAGKVYLVIGSDTAVWNAPGGVDVSLFGARFNVDLYTQPQNNAARVMDPAFRNRFADSYGLPLRMTWWMLVGGIYRQAANTDVPVPNQMSLHLMQSYYGEAMRSLGDEVALHYHTFFWSDYNEDGKFFWNQSRTFNECREDFNFTLAQSLVEEEFFPASFRSGWHYMDNDWQQALNDLIPFSLHNASPIIRQDTTEPLDNVYDWSLATTAFVPFHPSPTNYQTAGDSPGWNVRSVKISNLSQTTMNLMFAQAAGGTDQVACLWVHLPESDFLTNLLRADTLAHVAAKKHPSVSFRYCTAVEAMQRWMSSADQTPPRLELSEETHGEVVTLHVRVNEPIFQPQPFVALKEASGQYSILPCTPDGTNAWTVAVPAPRSGLAKIGVAVTDPAGNLSKQFLRYLPDDLYLDNLDPAYAELQGNWTSTNTAAWGTNARLALLTENDTARVRWTLPITQARPYQLLVQAPAISNAAARLVFQVYSGMSLLRTISLPDPLPPRQWVYLATPFLNPAQENRLEMTVNGSGQPDTFAVADVVKVSALPLTAPALTQARLEGATFSVSAPTLAGLTYILESKNSLRGPTWTARQTRPGDGTALTFTDAAANVRSRFYRLRVE